MRKILYMLIIVHLSFQTVHSQGWVQQYYDQSLAFGSIFFIDNNSGWVASGRGVGQGYHGEIRKSSNGGINWSVIHTDNISFADVHFVNTLTGWATGLKRENFVYTRPILKSTDGGTTFFHQHSDTTSYSPLKIDFVNSSTGFVFTMSNNILKTTNAGLTWQSYITGSSNSIADGMFTSPDTGWIASSFSTVLKTTNGGINWFTVHGAGKIFWKSISFINNLTGWVGDGGWLQRTTDGGSTWNNLNGGSGTIINFASGSIGWKCGRNSSAIIGKTTNGGSTFVNQTGVYDNFVFTDLFFLNVNTGWAVAYRYLNPNYYSMILKTTNGGVTYATHNTTEVPEKFLLHQNYPNPFNPTTKIKFDLPQDVRRETQDVKVIVFDAVGREVTTLAKEKLVAGSYEVEFNGSNLSSGIYFYKIQTDDPSTSSGQVFSEVKRMILLK